MKQARHRAGIIYEGVVCELGSVFVPCSTLPGRRWPGKLIAVWLWFTRSGLKFPFQRRKFVLFQKILHCVLETGRAAVLSGSGGDTKFVLCGERKPAPGFLPPRLSWSTTIDFQLRFQTFTRGEELINIWNLVSSTGRECTERFKLNKQAETQCCVFFFFVRSGKKTLTLLIFKDSLLPQREDNEECLRVECFSWCSENQSSPEYGTKCSNAAKRPFEASPSVRLACVKGTTKASAFGRRL